MYHGEDKKLYGVPVLKQLGSVPLYTGSMTTKVVPLGRRTRCPSSSPDFTIRRTVAVERGRLGQGLLGLP
jgi:hypothetical protein